MWTKRVGLALSLSLSLMLSLTFASSAHARSSFQGHCLFYAQLKNGETVSVWSDVVNFAPKKRFVPSYAHRTCRLFHVWVLENVSLGEGRIWHQVEQTFTRPVLLMSPKWSEEKKSTLTEQANSNYPENITQDEFWSLRTQALHQIGPVKWAPPQGHRLSMWQ